MRIDLRLWPFCTTGSDAFSDGAIVFSQDSRLGTSVRNAQLVDGHVLPLATALSDTIRTL